MDSKNSLCQILLVDDDATSAIIGKKTLEKSGFTVAVSHNATQALDYMKHYTPEIILLDVIMPEIDGYELCTMIRKHENWQGIPIIMMTSLDDHEMILKAYQSGANDFICKPIDWKILSYRIKYMLSASHAVNQLHSTVNDLKHSQQRLISAQRIARLGNWEWNKDSNYFKCSKEVYSIIEPTHCRELTFDNYIEHIHPDDRITFINLLNKTAMDGKQRRHEHRLLCANNEIKTAQQIFEANPDLNSDMNIISGSIQDITERKRIEERMYYLANFDELTNLPNRQQFKLRATEELEHCMTTNERLAIIFLDLDNFKKINDTLGHRIGDLALIEAAMRINKVCRNSDIVVSNDLLNQNIIPSRFGGDEFIIMARSTGPPTYAANIAKRILESIMPPIQLEEYEFTLTGSIGISMYPDDGDDLETLVKRADSAMYESKSLGRNCYRYYSQSIASPSSHHLALESHLSRAIENGEFTLYYQPKYDLNCDRISSVEALIRWNHPKYGFVMPDTFIPIAEDAGLIINMGRWVIEQVCRQIQSWSENGLNLQVSLNVSSAHFTSPAFTDDILSATSKFLLPSNALEIEITESTLLHNIDQAITTIENLRKIGILTAIDDFGTGYSSFKYLQKLPIHRLKIDRSFIQNITSNDSAAAIVKSLIEMSHALKLQVTAEGIETKEQLQQLIHFCCDEAQGFYISKPVATEKLVTVITDCNGIIRSNYDGSSF